MATLYGMNAGGTWGTAATWSTDSRKDANRAANPSSSAPAAADTCILDDYSGNITMGANGTCLNLTMTGYTGTLALVTYTLNIAAGGSIVLGGTTSSTNVNGQIGVTTSVSITSNGLTLNCSLASTSTIAITLVDDLNIARNFSTGGVMTIAGAFDITCHTLLAGATSTVNVLTLKAGQTLNITNAMGLTGRHFSAFTIRSDSAGNDAFLHYQGAAADCKIAGATFTDIDASTSHVTLYNWYGGSATNHAKGLVTVTVESFPAASSVLDSATTDGYHAGTIATRTADNSTVSQLAGYYAAFNLTTVDADLVAANIKTGVTVFGIAGEAAAGGGGLILINGAWKTISSILMMVAGAWKEITS